MSGKAQRPTKIQPQAVSTQHELVECDLEFPRIIEELGELETAELNQGWEEDRVHPNI